MVNPLKQDGGQVGGVNPMNPIQNLIFVRVLYVVKQHTTWDYTLTVLSAGSETLTAVNMSHHHPPRMKLVTIYLFN